MERPTTRGPKVATTVLEVAYDGSAFAGFARQKDQQTVQGRIETALATVLGEVVETTGAGRTDAGVHALAQHVSFPTSLREPKPAALARSLTALAGPEIVVRRVRHAREGFSARFDAVAREYRYRIAVGSSPPVFLSRLAWHVSQELDVEAMRLSTAALIGEHDFRSFCVAASAEGQRTVRSIGLVDVFSEEPLGERCLTIRVEGNAFLHSMVRVIVGSLVEVGVGRRPAEWMQEALQAERREAAGPTAPPHALTLWHVRYPDEVWLEE
jgi:tRNA pseudouridine38-40 synthase